MLSRVFPDTLKRELQLQSDFFDFPGKNREPIAVLQTVFDPYLVPLMF
jgi:hypothetical protein